MPHLTPPDIATEAAALPPRRGAVLRHDVAAVVSAIIHPIVFPLVTILVVGMVVTKNNLALTLFYALLAVMLTAVPVSLVVYVQVKRGKWSDFDVSQRKQRYTLYPLTLLCLCLLSYVYYRIHARMEAVQAVLSLLLANIINGFINLYWKVSAHATTAAACAALLWQFAPTWGPPAAAGAVLVGWSRVELKRHTAGQVLVGWLVGASSALLLGRL